MVFKFCKKIICADEGDGNESANDETGTEIDGNKEHERNDETPEIEGLFF